MNIAPDHHLIMARLKRLDSAYQVSPLSSAPKLAAHLGVAEIHLKDESRRPLGSFKSLGGTFAGLEAIATGGETVRLLVCASDGNHGLAVASAARHTGIPAKVFLHSEVARARVNRIEQTGAQVVIVPGTFDDAVNAAAHAAKSDGAVLVADTSDNENDVMTGHVMAGYGVIAGEAREQYAQQNFQKPTHLFIQAGVGGLAAAMARGLYSFMEAPGIVVVVEPANAACVQVAMELGYPETISGELRTCASMLSCGRASAPALRILQASKARTITVSEEQLMAAPALLAQTGAIATTPSGGAGLAGLTRALASPVIRQDLGLNSASRVLLVVSEGPQE
ncbi:pyridoxal-phosphate dependent enzyme [Nitratireductor sp.]|uniref:pyridoxal-phosphate dependent enzyme n=1 Tax=Nitratireductor sp. TaxID=1872084 RepID=UPI0025F759E3|nr:pyridoxal-phosphate dependent enzyme [Nitratireductor sp.]